MPRGALPTRLRSDYSHRQRDDSRSVDSSACGIDNFQPILKLANWTRKDHVVGACGKPGNGSDRIGCAFDLAIVFCAKLPGQLVNRRFVADYEYSLDHFTPARMPSNSMHTYPVAV